MSLFPFSIFYVGNVFYPLKWGRLWKVPGAFTSPKENFAQQNINIRVLGPSSQSSPLRIWKDSFILVRRASTLNVNMANVKQGLSWDAPNSPVPAGGGILRNSFDTVISYLRHIGRVYKKGNKKATRPDKWRDVDKISLEWYKA